MGKMTGLEPVEEIPSKVLMAYGAVQALVGEGRDVNDISVSNITERAGIGKGTIYDYFESREELIACAFLFYISRASEKITQAAQKMHGVREQIYALFDELDKDSEKKSCFVQFVHSATDNSKYSPLVREKLAQSPHGKNLPYYLFGEIMRGGIESGEINDKLPMEYLLYTVFCKVLTYMMCLATEECFGIDIAQMRELVIEGILKEIKKEP